MKLQSVICLYEFRQPHLSCNSVIFDDTSGHAVTAYLKQRIREVNARTSHKITKVNYNNSVRI